LAQKLRVARKGSKPISPIFSIAIIVVVLVGGFFAGRALGWWGANESDDNSASNLPTKMTFVFKNSSGSLLDGEDGADLAYGYMLHYEIADVDEWTIDDQNDLGYSDFHSCKEEIETGDSFDPADDEIYIMLVNCSGYTDVWIVPVLGENIVILRTIPTNISLTMVSSLGSNTENQTNDQFWYGSILCANADHEIDSNVGYDLVYNFTTITEMEDLEESLVYPVLCINFNGTSVTGKDVDVDGLSVEKIVMNSDVMEIYLNQAIYGKMDFSIEFSDDLGVDFEVESIYLARGPMEGTLTTLCSA
jgi:hypothetical protein